MCNTNEVQILPSIENQDDQIIEEYLQRQKAVYSLDFTDLMSYALYLLQKDEEVREKWQSRLNYIQVDEFQDSSKTEMTLVDILSEKYQNLMIVGDPDQNIYEWRGSDVSLLVDFDKRHPGTKTVILNQNYRSTPQILKCANTLIEKNELRLEKDLFTLGESGVAVKHIHSKTEDDEVARIVKEIKDIKRSGNFSFSDFAILYRSGFLSRVIERKLVEENVPYEIYGGVKFYQRMEILDVVAYLRLIAFNDDLSFKRIINTPRRKFGRARVAALENIRENNETSLFEEDLRSLSLYEILKTHLGDPAFNGSGGVQFISIIENLKKLKNCVKISEIVNRTCIDLGYEQYIRELGDEERLYNLSEFKRIANEFEREFGEDVSLEEFLQQIALMSAEDTDKPIEAVKLMTIHASKGLEFPVVFVVGFTEGIFPSSKTIEERKKLGLEEERRLCYVAITRAQKRLYIMDSEGLSQQGIKKLPSRFLFEIGEENYQRFGKFSDDLVNEAFVYIRKLNLNMIETPLALPSSTSSNEIVKHHIFGNGKIIAYDDKRKVYNVKFDNLPQLRSINAEYFANNHENIDDKGIGDEPPRKLPVWNDSDEDEAEKEEFTIFSPETSQNISSKSESEEEEEMEESFDADDESDEETPPDIDNLSDELKEKLANATNHWLDPDFPKTGWTCTGIEDLGSASGICQMCGYQIIRYVHYMYHPQAGTLECGCVCAGKMEGNIDHAKMREAAFKNKLKRKINFRKRKWKMFSKGNEYTKYKSHLIVILHWKNPERWKYSLDQELCKESYNTRQEAIDAVFEKLEEMIYKK